MKTLITSLLLAILTASLVAAEKPAPPAVATATNDIVFRELRYEGKVTDNEALFTCAAAMTTGTWSRSRSKWSCAGCRRAIWCRHNRRSRTPTTA